MQIDVITLFPEFVQSCAQVGVVGRAQLRGLLRINAINPRDYAQDRHRKVDERPFGGGPGMVMMVEPLRTCIRALRAQVNDSAKVIYLSPQGTRLTQKKVETLGLESRLILLCGRYEGIDERLLQSDVDAEISIGDYVLSGGELAAAVLIDALGRLRDGALGDSESAVQDSFTTGLLDCPHYTRPEHEHGVDVPAELLSGDHAAIARWRLKQSLLRTWLRRPDLLSRMQLSATERLILNEAIRENQGIK